MRIPGSSGNSSRSLAEICCGDQPSSRPRSTSATSAPHNDSFVALGRRAHRCARRSAPIARYRCRPPPARISRHTVDGARPNALAIARADSPTAIPREIRSRSSNDNRCGECTTRRPINAASCPIRHADECANPNSAITSLTRAPARNRATITRRSDTDNNRYRPRFPANEPSDQHENTIVLRQPDESTPQKWGVNRQSSLGEAMSSAIANRDLVRQPQLPSFVRHPRGEAVAALARLARRKRSCRRSSPTIAIRASPAAGYRRRGIEMSPLRWRGCSQRRWRMRSRC
jgi:hypothetical protein